MQPQEARASVWAWVCALEETFAPLLETLFWFSFYLSEHSFLVSLADSSSDLDYVDMPQSSVLRPLHFSVFPLSLADITNFVTIYLLMTSKLKHLV